jgi:hypothetical protein
MRSLVRTYRVPVCGACAIRRNTSSRSVVERRPLPHDDPRQHGPDTSRSRQSLSWASSVPFEDGPEHAFEYFAKQTNGPLLPALRPRSHTRARWRSKPAKSYFSGQGSRP